MEIFAQNMEIFLYVENICSQEVFSFDNLTNIENHRNFKIFNAKKKFFFDNLILLYSLIFSYNLILL